MTAELAEEIVVTLTIIAEDLDQVHNDVNDDVPSAAGSVKQANNICLIPLTSTADSHLRQMYIDLFIYLFRSIKII